MSLLKEIRRLGDTLGQLPPKHELSVTDFRGIQRDHDLHRKTRIVTGGVGSDGEIRVYSPTRYRLENTVRSIRIRLGSGYRP